MKILDMLYDGQIYPAETVKPATEKYQRLDKERTQVLDELHDSLADNQVHQLERVVTLSLSLSDEECRAIVHRGPARRHRADAGTGRAKPAEQVKTEGGGRATGRGFFLLERRSMAYIHFTDQQKEKARHTDLAGLLRSQGETLRKSGSELEWLDGSQKVTIRGNLWFHQYEQVGGDSIDFVRKFYHKSYPEAMEYLLGQSGGMLSVMPPKQKLAPKFELPPANHNMRRVFAYLLNRRGIDKDVLYAFVHKKMIYESAQYHNVVFVGFDNDGTPRHANKRGTGSASTYKGNAAGSVPEYSFHWNGRSDRLYLFEAPIDMLSFISMNKDGWRDHSYAAACSVSDKVLFQCLHDNSAISKVSICFDSDEPGQLAAQRINAKLIMQGVDSEILVPVNKDWNEDLQCDEGLEVDEPCQTLRR